MNPGAVLEVAVRELAAAGVPYMLTGSFAAAYHGTPRATQDIDLVIHPTRSQLRTLVGRFPPARYYVDESAALEALDNAGQFNVIDTETGWKIDFIIRRARPFSRGEFERRQEVDLDGVPLFVVTAEDLLIAKLEWARMGGSSRQIEDVAGILRVRADQLDLPYVERWVGELELSQEWGRARRLAGADGA